MSLLLWIGWIVLVWAMSSLTLSTGIGAGAVYAPALVFIFGLDLPVAIATTIVIQIVIQIAGIGSTAISHLSEGHTDSNWRFVWLASGRSAWEPPSWPPTRFPVSERRSPLS